MSTKRLGYVSIQGYCHRRHLFKINEEGVKMTASQEIMYSFDIREL